ncbi:hypothetical protein LTV02_37365 [Nocardia yamanashiensis]|uniref:hypothetical protein n=1 Tax=Nocardia yamanashiensis TaxID=209247 RepID=UPI001E64E809|nr:hypothetical protein [Nocardia yamanashiensis]UGT41537.1 hypothetical protein LTV02_37365 [Nocardia yamanashiensis]
MADYAHSDHASRSREDKARRLAAYVWQRGITGGELLDLPMAQRRKLARAADANPPSTDETWQVVARMLAEKDAWAERNPAHPGARREFADEKILWVKPPVKPWE